MSNGPNIRQQKADYSYIYIRKNTIKTAVTIKRWSSGTRDGGQEWFLGSSTQFPTLLDLYHTLCLGKGPKRPQSPSQAPKRPQSPLFSIKEEGTEISALGPQDSQIVYMPQ